MRCVFEVDDVNAVYRRAMLNGENGAKAIMEPWIESAQDGEVVIAKIRTYGDTVRTLIERGRCLPGFSRPES